MSTVHSPYIQGVQHTNKPKQLLFPLFFFLGGCRAGVVADEVARSRFAALGVLVVVVLPREDAESEILEVSSSEKDIRGGGDEFEFDLSTWPASEAAAFADSRFVRAGRTPVGGGISSKSTISTSIGMSASSVADNSASTSELTTRAAAAGRCRLDEEGVGATSTSSSSSSPESTTRLTRPRLRPRLV